MALCSALATSLQHRSQWTRVSAIERRMQWHNSRPDCRRSLVTVATAAATGCGSGAGLGKCTRSCHGHWRFQSCRDAPLEQSTVHWFMAACVPQGTCSSSNTCTLHVLSIIYDLLIKVASRELGTVRLRLAPLHHLLRALLLLHSHVRLAKWHCVR